MCCHAVMTRSDENVNVLNVSKSKYRVGWDGTVGHCGLDGLGIES